MFIFWLLIHCIAEFEFQIVAYVYSIMLYMRFGWQSSYSMCVKVTNFSFYWPYLQHFHFCFIHFWLPWIVAIEFLYSNDSVHFAVNNVTCWLGRIKAFPFYCLFLVSQIPMLIMATVHQLPDHVTLNINDALRRMTD